MCACGSFWAVFWAYGTANATCACQVHYLISVWPKLLDTSVKYNHLHTSPCRRRESHARNPAPPKTGKLHFIPSLEMFIFWAGPVLWTIPDHLNGNRRTSNFGNLGNHGPRNGAKGTAWSILVQKMRSQQYGCRFGSPGNAAWLRHFLTKSNISTCNYRL